MSPIDVGVVGIVVAAAVDIVDIVVVGVVVDID